MDDRDCLRDARHATGVRLQIAVIDEEQVGVCRVPTPTEWILLNRTCVRPAAVHRVLPLAIHRGTVAESQ